ncbi:NAD-dependent epimerase/dehydratase family protein [uncultured Vibrio sp.]|uniref:NAD-dependent epimerase/dehydratase family protein n=1 Tax=uncultured Vibrio sp. TaxID=114054 RepID=UPI0025CFFF75|nr:NAD-dependent epimerase/dehydratase family protein [uncultured Vibrio sp.]
MSKRVLITGATGNIGTAVVNELIAHHYKVAGLARSQQSATLLVERGAEVVMGDIEQPNVWLSALDQFDAIIHLACGFGEDMARIDQQFLSSISRYSETRKTPLVMIYTSGCWVYGNHSLPVIEESTKHSIADFQWMVDGVDFLKRQNNIDCRVVSPANVVKQEDQFIPDILRWELQQMGEVSIPNVSSLCWSLVERTDLAALYRLVLENGLNGHEYIGAAIESVSVASLAEKITDKKASVTSIQAWIERYGSWAEGYGLLQTFSSNKAKTDLGWQPVFSEVTNEN